MHKRASDSYEACCTALVRMGRSNRPRALLGTLKAPPLRRGSAKHRSEAEPGA